jgi:GntR family transcriptional regulator
MRLSKRALSPIPLYFKVMMDIRDKILSGTWSHGFRIPGELELARRHGVSVITMRQSLGHLTQEGLLMRERAKGTFVSWNGPLKQSVQLEIETEELAPVDPEGTSFNVLDVKNIAATDELRHDFGLRPDEKVMQIERIRMIHGQPLAYVISYAPSRFVNQISVKRLKTLPLSTAVESSLNIKLSNVRHVVGAKLSDDEISAHLKIPPGSPVLFVEREHFHKKALIMRTEGFYRSDLFRYELKLKRKNPGRSTP